MVESSREQDANPSAPYQLASPFYSQFSHFVLFRFSRLFGEMQLKPLAAAAAFSTLNFSPDKQQNCTWETDLRSGKYYFKKGDGGVEDEETDFMASTSGESRFMRSCQRKGGKKNTTP